MILSSSHLGGLGHPGVMYVFVLLIIFQILIT